HGLQQDFLQLVVALQASTEIAQLGSQIQQLLEGSDLLGDVFGGEVVHALEVQVDFQLWRVGILAELVFDRKSQVRLHAFQNAVEVVGIHLDKLAVAQAGERIGWHAGKISQHSHDEGKLLEFNRVSDFNVVGDVHAWGPDSVQLMLCA